MLEWWFPRSNPGSTQSGSDKSSPAPQGVSNDDSSQMTGTKSSVSNADITIKNNLAGCPSTVMSRKDKNICLSTLSQLDVPSTTPCQRKSVKVEPLAHEIYDEKIEGPEIANPELNLRTMRWGTWGQPLGINQPIRSKKYLETQMKEPSKPHIFKTVMVDTFIGESPVTHVAAKPFSWFQKNRPTSGFTFIHTILVNSIGCSVVSYHHGPNKSELPQLFQDFLEKGDDFRNNRLKMIPKVVRGPWIVRKSVQSVPIIIGRKVTLTFFQGKDYLECDMLCDSSFLASSIISFARPMAESITVQLQWTVEGRSEEELPERLFAGVLFQNLTFNKFDRIIFNDLKNPVGVLPPEDEASPNGNVGITEPCWFPSLRYGTSS